MITNLSMVVNNPMILTTTQCNELSALPVDDDDHEPVDGGEQSNDPYYNTQCNELFALPIDDDNHKPVDGGEQSNDPYYNREVQ